MKNLQIPKLILLLFILLSPKVFSQSKQWTWINGDNSINQHGVYDLQGMPSGINKPGARSEAASWKDKSGNMWLFGGVGYGYYNAWGAMNDLWKYNPCTNEWTWLKGAQTPNANGVYGTRGIPSSGNNPGARQMSGCWTDANGNLWLFGGSGATFYNDLWKFDITSNQWTWMNGDNIGNKRAVYGTKRVASSVNKPGARNNPSCWTDNSGNLWMYGGNGYAASGGGGYLGDLWKYNIDSDTWTWMHGDSVIAAQSNYGDRNISSPLNKPGSRTSASSWTDQSGNLWLLGGFGYASGLGIMNDLWKYNISTNEWVWVHGDNITNHFAVYGNTGTAGPSNRPGGIMNAATWVDPSGDLWLFGGRGNTNTAFGELNALWKYNVVANQWTFVKGDISTYGQSEYGVLGVPAESNKPGSREEPVAWADSLGNLWMFGGESYPMNSTVTYFLNDLWKFSYVNLLPVKLRSFNGKIKNNDILLNWTVEDEVGLDRYEIEKSFNGTTFKSIAHVKAINKKNYEFTDYDASYPGTIYYRIRMVDIDGKLNYSNIINFRIEQTQQFTLYPNPANGYTQIRFNKNINEKISIEILDAAGRVVTKNAYELRNGACAIEISSISSGIYTAAVFYHGERFTQSLVIQK